MKISDILLFLIILLVVILVGCLLAKMSVRDATGGGLKLDLAANIIGPVAVNVAKTYIPNTFDIADYAPVELIDVKCSDKPKIALHVDSNGLGFAICLPNKQILEYNMQLSSKLHEGYSLTNVYVEPPEKLKKNKITVNAWHLLVLSTVVGAVIGGVANPNDIIKIISELRNKDTGAVDNIIKILMQNVYKRSV